jgi:HEAT repeat protein
MRTFGVGGILVACALAAPARAAETEIAWRPGLAKAFEEAKAAGKAVFVAINAERVDAGRVEPASRLLREEVYRHPDVVARSRDLVCVLLTDPISEADGAELRARFGVGGDIVSPQHLLAHADGATILRKEYWPHPDLASSVEALTALMTRAAKANEARRALPARGADAASKAAWVAAALALCRTGADVELRRAAAREVVADDASGDGAAALGGLLSSSKEAKKDDVAVLVEVARLLGRPGAERAVPGLCAALESKDAALRSEAAVSLEHVGSAAAVPALVSRVGKEKDEAARCNACRALGRCGARDASAKAALLRELRSARTDRAAVGPLVGLSYFEGDADVARAVEGAARKDDKPLRLAAVCFALGEIGDAGSREPLRGVAAAAGRDPWLSPCAAAASARLDARTDAAKARLAGAFCACLRRDGRPDPARSGRESGFVPNGDLSEA